MGRRRKGRAKKLFRRILRSIPLLFRELPTLVAAWPTVKIQLKKIVKDAETDAKTSDEVMVFYDSLDAIWRRFKGDVE